MNIILMLLSYHTDEGLSASGKQRVKHAASILHAEPESTALITGGELSYGVSGLHHQYVSKQLLQEGIPTDRILATLADAAHTADEAADAAVALELVDYESLVVVTSFVHYPRAPFIFAHFFDLPRLQFVFVPDDSAKDVTRFNYLHEMEAYQEDRRRGGLILRDGSFLQTNFDYPEFTELLRNRTDLRLPGMREHEAEVTKDMDLFEYYDPNSPYIYRQNVT